MSIFGKIKDAIFGVKPAAAPASTPTPAAPTAAAPSAPAAAPAPAAPAPIGEVDVLANLEALAAGKGATLNWRTSIVDLMKLLDLDSSLQNREELAKELGYTGALDGSAAMNIWLHKAVMRELAKNGGKVPAELTD
jgi:3-oxoacyl-ACP reductase-like protein